MLYGKTWGADTGLHFKEEHERTDMGESCLSKRHSNRPNRREIRLESGG